MIGRLWRAEPTGYAARLGQGYARVLSAAFIAFGLIGLFRTGLDHFSNVTGYDFLIFTVNPQTCVIHLVAGLVGVAMATSPGNARRWLLLVGALGVPWSVTGFVVDGTLSDFFARNPALNTVDLVVTAVALALAAWPPGEPRPRASEAGTA